MKAFAVAAAMLIAAQASYAQNTLDERIKRAQAAQAAREAQEAAKNAPQPAQAPGALVAPPGAPRVDLSGVRPGQVPAGGAQGGQGQPPADHFELVQIKGFLDEPASMEALVYYNGQRYALTAQQRRIPGGWELVSIGPEAVEISKGAEHRQIRFVQFFQPGGAGAAPGRAPAPVQQPAQPVRR